MRVRQDLAGGLVIVGVAALAFWQAADLKIGTLGGMGPGMLPKSLAVLLGLLGALLAVNAVRKRDGHDLDRLTLRAPLFVLGAVVVFGLTVRPLGLVIAGPLSIMTAAFGNQDVRWVEMIVFALVLTALCVGLFKFALGLPIPLAPWLLGY